MEPLHGGSTAGLRLGAVLSTAGLLLTVSAVRCRSWSARAGERTASPADALESIGRQVPADQVEQHVHAGTAGEASESAASSAASS
jgi:hypothetical protein